MDSGESAPVDVLGSSESPSQSNQATANKAKQLLVAKDERYREVTTEERSALAQAFAAEGFVVYGKAFDLVRLAQNVDLSDIRAIREAIHNRQVVLIEVKATSLAETGQIEVDQPEPSGSAVA